MSELEFAEAQVTLDARNGHSLTTKYYCQVTNSKAVEVVMELSSLEKTRTHRLPLRYVLVIDVSGSMDCSVGHTCSISLLDRIKIFANLVVQKMMKQDFLAIVSFACDVVVDMPLTLMDDNGKNNATYIIENLYTRGRTDLGLGLMEGLSVLNDKDNKQYRDMILIFTDGEVNEGERNASKLVEKYNEATKSLNRASCVPIAAFTIGQYVPDFLRELSSHLGSDAFYWLNEEEDFESDMLLPIFLRESTHVTDIAINMETLNGVTFIQRSLSRPHMKESSDTNLKYFIHGLPVAIKKHIPFSLMLPQDDIENLLGQKILHIEVTYLDENMEFQQFNDYINLSNITLNECKMGPKYGNDEPMNEISAYMVVQDTIYRVWEDSQSAIIAVADEKYRRATLNGIDNAEIKLRNDDREGQKMVIFHATNEIVSIRKTYIVLVKIDSFYSKHLRDGAKHWIAKLNTVGTLESLGRIFALKSSIETEMPTSKGVFEDVENQLYLPEQIEEKLTEIESDVKEEKKKRQLKGKKLFSSKVSPGDDQNTEHILSPLINNAPEGVKVTKKIKTKEHFGTSRVFEGKTLVISEALRAHKVGALQESYSEIIIRCGGRPSYFIITNPYEKRPKWYVDKTFDDHVLICGKKDFKKDSLSVHEAKKTQIPIVRTKFMFDCIRKKEFLKVENYSFT